MQRQKTMLVTGAADGTGFAIAARFAKEGWQVLVTSRDIRRAQAAAETIMQQYGTPAFGYALDGVDVQQVAALFDQLDRQDLCPDTVVLNAANLGIGMDPLTVSAEDFMAVLQTNVGWNFAIVQQAARRMKQAGGGAVSATVTGKRELTALTIDPDVVDPEDVEMLQDLIMAAVNEALRAVESDSAATMGQLTGGLGLPF